MNRKGRLIIISSPSGGGKSSVIRKFLSTHPNMMHSISCTTRPVRKDSRDVKDYKFVTHETFHKWIEENKFAEWAMVHNNYYGTPKEDLQNAIDEGIDVMLDVDVVGGMNLKKMYGDRAIAIFLLPPSIDELKKRLGNRGTDPIEVQQLRLTNAMTELTYKDKFDHQVVNDNLDRACSEIEQILAVAY
ncbi:MAG: guanylate kinase [Candidatus Margulisbacteria bacterium]|nr:guanylate kinase [Candidatus Margulisiibacteriota bacterium]